MRRASGSWADGDYELALGTERCSFSVPRDLPPVGSTTTVECNQGTPVLLGNSGFGASLTTTPKTLTVELTLDGAVILSESVTPSYQDSQPNGPDCGPVCRQGTLDFVVTQ